KIVRVEVRHRPKAHSSGIEARYVVTSESPGLNGNLLVARGRPDKNVDDMLPVTIDKRSDRSSAEIIKASADQGKAFAGEVFYRRCEIESRGKPGFDGVSFR